MVQALQRPTQNTVTYQQMNRTVAYSTKPALSVQLAEARETARAMSQTYGITSPESSVAWEIVEELLVAQSRQLAKQPMTPFEEYCKQYPDAPESRIYDV
ncbi:MAG TPA: Calvin cycle protein CP12 [Elainellaceae cyanobacterium]